MRGMKRVTLGCSLAVSLLAVGCGPSYGGQDAKSPDEIVAEQEALGAQQIEKEKQTDYSGPVGETDLEKKSKWDKKQVEMELTRATRSAQTCPGSVPEKSPKGVAPISLTFGNDGHVKKSTIGSPYEDTAVGACVLRAMGAVIVPAYEGSEQTVEWEVDLTGSGEPEKSDKEKEKEPAKAKKK